MTNRSKGLVALLFLFCPPGLAAAQPMEPELGPPGGMAMGPPGRMGGPAFLDKLFPPGLVMRNQEALNLSEAQHQDLTKQMEESQKSMVTLQWDVERESEKLGKLLAVDHVDEAAALKQAETTMAAEGRLKRAHLALLIRIKNTLTPAQQEILRKLRPARGRMP